MPSGSSSTAEPKLAPVPLSTVFCTDDADVIIRAAGTYDFRVHKPILSLVSPFFKDMFTVPQPPTDTPDTLPHVDVEESAETWDYILRTIYPVPHPIVNNLDYLESLPLAAKKYEMQYVIDSHIGSFKNRLLIRQDPLHLYAVACACGFDDQAKYVAKHAERLAVTRRSNASSLKGLTVESYHRLTSFLAERDNEWYPTLRKTGIPHCRCSNSFTLYNNIKDNLKVVYFLAEEIYLKALEDPARLPDPGCNLAEGCAMAASRIKAYIERRVKQRDAVCLKYFW